MSRLTQALQRAAGKEVRASGHEASRSHPAPVLALDSALAAYPSESVDRGQPAPTEIQQPLIAPTPAIPLPVTERVELSTDPDLDGKLVGTDALAPEAANAYGKLADALEEIRHFKPVRTVMVSSPRRGEGKTLTAVNLASTLAQRNSRRVLLIDADLRSPSIHSIFRLSNATGLSELLNASDGAAPIVQVSDQLTLLTSGRPAVDPMAALVSPRMRAVLLEAARSFDWVIVDTPPVDSVEDPHLLAWLTDGAVLVVRAGRTPISVVQDAIATLGNDRVLGVVLNAADVV